MKFLFLLFAVSAHARNLKSSKKKKRSDYKENKTCTLPAIDSSVGQPYWVQTGQVMTQFNDATIPRKKFAHEAEIKTNDQYMVQCSQRGFVPDEMCVYTCVDGNLDTETYCFRKPEDVCVEHREMTISKQCPLDFDSDKPFFEGKSLKQWWKEVLDKYHFSREDIFSRKSEVPLYLGHGAGVLEGYGFCTQHFVVPATSKKFDADAIELTGWLSEGYTYGLDKLKGSKTAPFYAYLKDLETEDLVMGDFKLPNVVQPIKDFHPTLKIVSLLRDYDPCDDSTYLGFSPECFIYHFGGYHTGDGGMLPFRKPLADGNIDLLGVCTGAETAPPVLIDGFVSNYAHVSDYVDKAGGTLSLHPASWSMHLCIDEDIYHPYLCSVHPSLGNIDGKYVEVDPAAFMPIPSETRKKLCEKREAGVCDTDISDTSYPYPWTQHL